MEVATRDFIQWETFAHADTGVEGIFMMNGALESEVFKTLVASIKAQGEPRVIFLSSLFASIPDSRIGAMHKEKEDAIREAGLPGASLGAGGFMTNCFQWIGSIRADNAVFNPFGKGKVA